MKADDEKVAAYERELPHLLRALRDAPDVERSESEEASRAARILQGVDAALQTPARRALTRAARPAAALLLAAGVILALLSSGRLRTAEPPPAIQSEQLARPQDHARAKTNSEQPLPPPMEQIPAGSTQVREPALAPRPVNTSNIEARGTATVPAVSAGGPTSTLAEENRLFAEAAAAQRAGDLSSALASWDQLITAYPASPLAQQAWVSKFRALERANRRIEAAQTARRYLKLYPTGFAEREATQLAASGD